MTEKLRPKIFYARKNARKRMFLCAGAFFVINITDASEAAVFAVFLTAFDVAAAVAKFVFAYPVVIEKRGNVF